LIQLYPVFLFGLAFVLVPGVFFPSPSRAYTGKEINRFQHKIVDFRHRLNSKYKKRSRSRTNFIIVHTSELGLEATLRVVSKGKHMKNGRSTPGGHANYVVARNGKVYRLLDRRYRADHAGLSMWNGIRDLSSVSVGIELVGYHYAPISQAQYQSLGILLQILKKTYKLNDKSILTHSQIAYGRPNPWFRKNHRGRKRCAKNFDRARAGLGPTWTQDPDVLAGRLMSDPTLASVFYKISGAVAARTEREKMYRASGSNIISKENSAWSIAGEEYNVASTAYILPGGRAVPGNQVGGTLGWSHLPSGTRVLLNQEPEVVMVQAKNPVKEISGRMTAWSHAGQDYRSDSTIYFLPSGRISPGSSIQDWDDLPPGTRLMVGYKGPYSITKTKTAYKIAGLKYKDMSVVYRMPGGRLITGDNIRDFNDLPSGVTLYLPLALGG